MNNRKAFTMVELLTVVTIIALLLGILLPSISAIRTKARAIAQKAQFNTIEMALEAFKQAYGDYPPSDYDDAGPPMNYMGSQKLAEALLGWDLMGFHPKTGWRADGYSDAFGGTASYDPLKTRLTPSGQPETLFERKGPYLEVSKANAFKLGDLYNLMPYSDTNVLCDMYKVRKLIDKTTGKVVFAGSPILYYKAKTSNKTIDPTLAPMLPGAFPSPLTFSDRIYNYNDNYLITSSNKLIANGQGPLNRNYGHPLDYFSGSSERPVFYGDKTSYAPGTTYGGSGIGYGIRDTQIGTPLRPYNPDTYILISAGPDGFYGTADDIDNF
jgi:prepilin-type N-terminal cleavage/methylation domain-containing protein